MVAIKDDLKIEADQNTCVNQNFFFCDDFYMTIEN